MGVEIGGGVGLHYHYGTLGQLEHGVNYAEAYLRTIGKGKEEARELGKWPYEKGSKVTLFILAGHRNMDGVRSFVQDLQDDLAKDDATMAYRYSIGGGYKISKGWEPLGPAGFYIAFIKESVKELQSKGHQVELAGIFYRVGENEMSMPPYREQAPDWLEATITQSRIDLDCPKLKWFVSQQAPTNDQRVNGIEVTPKFAAMAEADLNLVHLKAFDLPKQEKKLVLDSAGVIRLGEILAEGYLKSGWE